VSLFVRCTTWSTGLLDVVFLQTRHTDNAIVESVPVLDIRRSSRSCDPFIYTNTSIVEYHVEHVSLCQNTVDCHLLYLNTSREFEDVFVLNREQCQVVLTARTHG